MVATSQVKVSKVNSSGLTMMFTEEQAEILGGLRASVWLEVQRSESGELIFVVGRGAGNRLIASYDQSYPVRVLFARTRGTPEPGTLLMDEIPEFGMSHFIATSDAATQTVHAISQSVDRLPPPKKYKKNRAGASGKVARAEELPYREALKAAIAAMNDAIKRAPENVTIEVSNVVHQTAEGVDFARIRNGESSMRARITLVEEF